jgi:glycosyltransferase involved in cell wall biosynthesis
VRAVRVGVNTLFHVPGDIGGTETYLREVLLTIAEEFPKVNLTLFTSLDNEAMMGKLFAVYGNVETCCLPFRARIRPLRIVAEQLWLPVEVWRRKVAALWSPGYTAPLWVPCPQVVTVHDLQYKSHPDDLTHLERLTLDLLVRSACRRCQSVLTVSEFSKSEIVRFGFAPASKVSATLAGVSHLFGEAVSYKEIEEVLMPGVSPRQPYILVVAHTYPHKNVQLAVEAFGLVCQEIPHNLVIVGKERLGEPKVREAIARTPYPDRIVRFNSGLSFSALRYLYQNAAAFVLPSLYEGFGLPVLEAMVAGTPVVSSRMASIPEVAGDYAFYYAKGDVQSLSQQIRAVIDMDVEQRSAWTWKAKAWALRFNWQQTARATINVLENAVMKT